MSLPIHRVETIGGQSDVERSRLPIMNTKRKGVDAVHTELPKPKHQRSTMQHETLEELLFVGTVPP